MYAPLHRSLRQRAGPPESGDLENRLLVEGLALEQRMRERIERLAMLVEQPLRLVVAFADDPPHFLVDELRGFLAERALTGIRRRPAQIGILARRELHHADALAHAPARDHLARQRGDLLDVALRA